MPAPASTYLTEAFGDCEPFESRDFISVEIAEGLEIDAIRNQKEPNFVKNYSKFMAMLLWTSMILVCACMSSALKAKTFPSFAVSP